VRESYNYTPMHAAMGKDCGCPMMQPANPMMTTMPAMGMPPMMCPMMQHMMMNMMPQMGMCPMMMSSMMPMGMNPMMQPANPMMSPMPPMPPMPPMGMPTMMNPMMESYSPYAAAPYTCEEKKK